MLTKKRLEFSGKGSVQGIVAYLEKSTEYYAGESDEILPPARWFGSIAARMGLNDPARNSNQDFARLLAGFDPNDPKKALVKNAGNENRRLGWDLTFSAEKDISILFATASADEQKRILEIHHKATNYALEYIRDNIRSRSGKGGATDERVEGFAVRQVDHLDSRNGDPQLHTHAVLINLAQCADGTTRAIEERELYAVEHSAGALYRQHMARGMKALGYGVELHRGLDADGRETGEVWTRIAGVGNDLRLELSSRRRDIEKAMAREGVSAQAASVTTRRNKSVDNEAAIVCANAQAKVKEFREQGRIDWTHAQDLHGRQGQELAPKTAAELLAELHQTESHWNRFDLIEKLAKELPLDRDAVKEADAALAHGLERGDLIRLRNDEHGRARYCTQEQADIERACQERATARQSDAGVRLGADTVRAAIDRHEAAQGFQLTDQQRKGIEFVTTQSGGVACISGFAGAGKTATIGAAVKAYEAEGWKVYGTSTGQNATEKLAAETGLESYNTTSLLSQLDSGKITLSPKSVIVLDEAGMVGAKTFQRIQAHVDAAGGKLIAVGDALQLQPIEAGSPFRQLTHDIGEARLSEIRRQKSEQNREIANAFYNGASGGEIMERWKSNGQMHTSAKRAQALTQCASAYLNDPKPAFDKLLLVQTHEDGKAITNHIREGLKQQGHLAKSESVQVTANSGKKEALDLAAGDRIRFNKNARNLGIANGDSGEILEIEAKGKSHLLRVRLDSEIPGKSGKILEIDTAKYDRLAHGYASTIHAAQGQGKSSVYWLMRDNQALDRSMGMVAFTRTKDTFQAFGTDRDAEGVKQRLGAWGKKETVKELSTVANEILTKTYGHKIPLKQWAREKKNEHEQTEIKNACLKNIQSQIDYIRGSTAYQRFSDALNANMNRMHENNEKTIEADERINGLTKQSAEMKALKEAAAAEWNKKNRWFRPSLEEYEPYKTAQDALTAIRDEGKSVVRQKDRLKEQADRISAEQRAIFGLSYGEYGTGDNMTNRLNQLAMTKADVSADPVKAKAYYRQHLHAPLKTADQVQQEVDAIRAEQNRRQWERVNALAEPWNYPAPAPTHEHTRKREGPSMGR